MPSINFKFNPPIIAHRGASAIAPENTLAAFLSAKKLGLSWVEFDVMLTKCGEAIIFHDETLTRTTNLRGKVKNFTWKQLKNLDAGSWFNSQFSQEKIPTFKEVIHLINRENLFANIEIKSLVGLEEQTTEKILEIIYAEWNADYQPLISSFSIKTLECVHRYAPKIPLGFLMHKWQKNWEKICDELECVTVDINKKILTAKRLEQIKKTGRLVLTYTVNDPDEAKLLFAMGVDAVFSDCPPEILGGINLFKIPD